MEIEDVKRIALAEGEVLWVTIPREHYMRMTRKQLEIVHEQFALLFLSNSIMITPDDYNFAVISPPSLQENKSSE